jgi:hypothetical protein
VPRPRTRTPLTRTAVEPEARRGGGVRGEDPRGDAAEARQPDAQDPRAQVCRALSPGVHAGSPRNRPTVESRLALYGTAQKQAEDVRIQLRKHHQTSVKKGGYKKFSIELESVRALRAAAASPG